jgi:hypothetical protein
MPALDSCYPQVVAALQREGWVVRPVPHAIRIPGRRYPLLADLRAEKPDQIIIIVEIKCFLDDPLQELYTCIGQYLVYRDMLTRSGRPYPLYLAIPNYAYNGIIDEVGAGVIRDTKIKLIVVNLDREEIEQWLN